MSLRMMKSNIYPELSCFMRLNSRRWPNAFLEPDYLTLDEATYMVLIRHSRNAAKLALIEPVLSLYPFIHESISPRF